MTPVSLMLAESKLTPLQARAATQLLSDHFSTLRWLDRGKLGDPSQARRYKRALSALGELRAPVLSIVVDNRSPLEWGRSTGSPRRSCS